MPPTKEQIAWAAGLFEGEGSVYWKDVSHRYVQATITQKDRWLLDKLLSIFEMGSINVARKYNHEKYPIDPKEGGTLYRWILYGSEATGFLLMIYDWLSPRRQQQVKEHGGFGDLEKLLGGSDKVMALIELLKNSK